MVPFVGQMVHSKLMEASGSFQLLLEALPVWVYKRAGCPAKAPQRVFMTQVYL
jgi:hypothetical protein